MVSSPSSSLALVTRLYYVLLLLLPLGALGALHVPTALFVCGAAAPPLRITLSPFPPTLLMYTVIFIYVCSSLALSLSPSRPPGYRGTGDADVVRAACELRSYGIPLGRGGMHDEVYALVRTTSREKPSRKAMRSRSS